MTTATVRIEDSPETGSVIATLEDGTRFAIESGEFERAYSKLPDNFLPATLPLTTFEAWVNAYESKVQWCEVASR